MTAPQIEWTVSATRQNWKHEEEPTTWTARFGHGYLVLHGSPTGGECMVWVPDSDSGLELS